MRQILQYDSYYSFFWEINMDNHEKVKNKAIPTVYLFNRYYSKILCVPLCFFFFLDVFVPIAFNDTETVYNILSVRFVPAVLISQLVPLASSESSRT